MNFEVGTILIIIGIFFAVGSVFMFYLAYSKKWRTQETSLTMPPSARPTWAIVCFIVAICFIVVGAYQLYSGNQRALDIQYLEQNGTRVSATITNVDYQSNFRVNGISPYIVYAEWTNPQTQQVYTFQSDDIWFDPSFELAHTTTIPVFFDPQNPTNYYVDVESLMGSGS